MNKFAISILLSSSLLLTACEQTMFGMPESQFYALTPAQQQEVIRGYNQRKQIEAANEPLNTLARSVSGSMRHQTTRTGPKRCRMEGNTQVCEQSGSSFGIGVGAF